jgi:hypothetical protein
LRLRRTAANRRTPFWRKCRRVVRQSGTLLVVELILPALVSEADPPLNVSDLNMLAVTGGRERRKPE